MHHLDWVAPFCVGVLLFGWAGEPLWVITRSCAPGGVLFNQMGEASLLSPSAHLACCVVSSSACSVCVAMFECVWAGWLGFGSFGSFRSNLGTLRCGGMHGQLACSRLQSVFDVGGQCMQALPPKAER